MGRKNWRRFFCGSGKKEKDPKEFTNLTTPPPITALTGGTNTSEFTPASRPTPVPQPTPGPGYIDASSPPRPPIFVSSALHGLRGVPDDLTFDPDASHALCVGVSEQIRGKPEENLGDVAENDAFAMASCFMDTFQIPRDRIEVLTNKKPWNTGDAVIVPMKDEVLGHLKTMAEKTGNQGILVLHMTSHGLRTDDRAAQLGYSGVLAPADYPPPGSWISFSHIMSCLRNCRARAVVLVLDACYSARVAREMCQSRRQEHLDLFVLAACSPDQEAMQWTALHQGLFTFLVRRALQLWGSRGALPLKKVTCYLAAVLQALQTLHTPGYGSHDSPQDPELCVRRGVNPGRSVSPMTSHLAPPTPPRRQMSRDPDLLRVETKRRQALDKDLFVRSPYPVANLPGPFADWMASPEVISSVHVLSDDGLFYETGFRHTTVAFFGRSVLQKLWDSGLRGELLNPRVVMAAWDTVPRDMFGYTGCGNFERGFQELKYFTEYYIKQTASLYRWPETHPRLQNLQDLLTSIKQIYSTHTFQYNGEGDESPEDLEQELDYEKPTLTVPELSEEEWLALAIPEEDR